MNSTEDSVIDSILEEASRIQEDALYSSKSHFNAGSTLKQIHYLVGCTGAASAAVAAAMLSSSWEAHAGIFAVAAAAATALTTFAKYSERAESHRSFGNQYLSICGRIRRFIKIESKLNKDHQQLQVLLTKICEEKDKLNEQAPLIPRRAYLASRKGIEDGESTHLVDK